MSSYEDEITPGDIVAVRHGLKGRQEGLVIGSHFDHQGRQIIEVQLEAEVYRVWQPHVTRVRRTISYSRPGLNQPHKVRTIERRILW
ncbi:hypothetical protein DXG03_009173 [Asterophora parasitica]|uniref:Uncharacterized protein n=1 Tax=Asterophora parasitica TaxID=117018 RepID=A0A9P7KB33_9AGAR|nr:hypothetical protein DXG03_009173 [Asterophora parasitica]